jgi:DNA-binding XRE family transcriptional regulator
MNEKMGLAEGIRDGREYLNFTPEQVANKIGLPVETYQAFEDGRQEPTERQQVVLAKLFGLTLERLRGAPMQADPEWARQVDQRDLPEEDRYQILRFVEFLQNADPPPPIDRPEAGR